MKFTIDERSRGQVREKYLPENGPLVGVLFDQVSFLESFSFVVWDKNGEIFQSWSFA
jgi:hypothetical protein